MPNEVLLAALAIGAIFLVVKSGDKEKKIVANKRQADQAGGATAEQAKRHNRTEDEDDTRKLWLARMGTIEQEYGDILRLEKDTQADIDREGRYPPKLWNRIRVLRNELEQMGRATKIVFQDKEDGVDQNYWTRFNNLWNGVQKMGSTQKGLLKKQGRESASKVPSTHVSNPVDGPKDKMQLVEFQQSIPGIDVPKITTEQLMEFNMRAFNMGMHTANLQNLVGDLKSQLEAQTTTKKIGSAFRMDTRPITDKEKASDRLNDDLGGAKKSDNTAPVAVPGNQTDKNVAGWGPNHGASGAFRAPKPYDTKKSPSLLKGAPRPKAITAPGASQTDTGYSRTVTKTVTETTTIPAQLGKAAKAAFNAAPAVNEHKDEPPALPAPRKPKPLRAPPPIPKADPKIQKAFNTANNPAINLKEKETDASQYSEGQVVIHNSTVPRTISAKQANIDLTQVLELDQFTQKVNALRDRLVAGMKTESPTNQMRAEANTIWVSLRDAMPVNATNKKMFKGVGFISGSWSQPYDRDLKAAIQNMPAYKVWVAAVRQCHDPYKEWSKKRKTPPVPLQKPVTRASKRSRTSSSKSRAPYSTRSQEASHSMHGL
jgi:hypothetical protein